MIGDLFEGSAESRRRLAVYCLKDAVMLTLGDMCLKDPRSEGLLDMKK